MKKVFLFVFGCLLLASCAGTTKSVEALKAQPWNLVSCVLAGDSVAVPVNVPELVFSDSAVLSGSAGCNRFFGDYQATNEGTITLAPKGMTMMACPEMDFEGRYLKALSEVTAFSIDDQRLTLTGGSVVLIYEKQPQMVGGDVDTHGCNASAGYVWSEVLGECIRVWEKGVSVLPLEQSGTAELSGYIVFAADSAKAELFLPGDDLHPVLDRRNLPGGGFAWNQEDDDTYNVRVSDGKWIVERRGVLLYSQPAQ